MTEPTRLRPNLTGSFSHPAGGNPTGAMVEAAYEHHGILARFVNCDVPPADLATAVAGARAMGWIGFNCSLPHKQAIIAEIDAVAPSARLIGAVNCVVRREDEWIGENTDGQGFLQAFTDVADPTGIDVTVLGAGGAARAIAVELALAGAATIRIVNRDKAKAEALARTISDATACMGIAVEWPERYRVPSETTTLINATSVGLAPDIDARLNIDFDTLHSEMVVCDVIPNPPLTELLRVARNQGAKTIDGRGMLVNQAAINIRLWTGVEPDRTVMRARLDEAIGEWRHPTSA